MAEGEKPAGSGTAFELPAQIRRVTLPPMPLPCPGLPSFAVYFRFRCGRRRPGWCLGDDRDGRGRRVREACGQTPAYVSGCSRARPGGRRARGSSRAGVSNDRAGTPASMGARQNWYRSMIGMVGASVPRLFGRALGVGRDRVSDAVNTLVLAYVGAAPPILLLFSAPISALPTPRTSRWPPRRSSRPRGIDRADRRGAHHHQRARRRPRRGTGAGAATGGNASALRASPPRRDTLASGG